MTPQNQKSLVVNIADKVFKIKVDMQNEDPFLNTIKLINLKLKEYKTLYPGLLLQEYLSMVLIWLAGEKTENIQDALINHNQQNNAAQQQIESLLNNWDKIINLDDNE